MSVLFILLMKFVIIPFVFLIVPMFLLIWLVLANDDSYKDDLPKPRDDERRD
jgi:hypothetical protein